MKIVAVVPIKKNSKRVKNKNFRKINGVPLFQITLDKLKKCNFDEIYVDSDSNIIKKYCYKKGINFIKRDPKLSKDSANGNHLLLHHAKIIDAGIFSNFVTLHFLKLKRLINVFQFSKIN